MRALEPQVSGVGDHAAEEGAGELSYKCRFFVVLLLVEAKDALVALQEDNRASVVHLVVERLDDLLF